MSPSPRLRAKRLTLVLLASVASPVIAAAQEHPWHVRFATGSAAIHGTEGDVWIEGRVGRSITAGGRVSVDLGVAASPADTGFIATTAGLELLPLPKAIVSPFVRGEGGLLVEGDMGYSGYVAGVGGGLAVRPSQRLHLRLGASWNVHGDLSNPTIYYLGLQYRW